MCWCSTGAYHADHRWFKAQDLTRQQTRSTRWLFQPLRLKWETGPLLRAGEYIQVSEADSRPSLNVVDISSIIREVCITPSFMPGAEFGSDFLYNDLVEKEPHPGVQSFWQRGLPPMPENYVWPPGAMWDADGDAPDTE